MVVNVLDLFTIRATVKPTAISEASTSLIQLCGPKVVYHLTLMIQKTLNHTNLSSKVSHKSYIEQHTWQTSTFFNNHEGYRCNRKISDMERTAPDVVI
jgi:hypothetical protein|uniref:Uncharacterized protein n=1 Tax=Zea mays TaxID=4577 RepID=C0PFK5_MAIZE|nr:unknown [Zea mays]